MRKLLIVTAIVPLLFLGLSTQSIAQIDVRVNVPAPPAFVFPAPPELVVIPGTYVYYAPDVDFDVFFYGGYWYRPYEGYWYRSVSYGGPWVYIEGPPSVLVSLPSDFRIVTRGFRHIPYGEFHRNWRTWQRDRYWEHHNWGRTEGRMERGRMEHEREHGLAPSYRGGEHGGYRGGNHEGGGFHGGDGHEGRERR